MHARPCKQHHVYKMSMQGRAYMSTGQNDWGRNQIRTSDGGFSTLPSKAQSFSLLTGIPTRTTAHWAAAGRAATILVIEAFTPYVNWSWRSYTCWKQTDPDCSESRMMGTSHAQSEYVGELMAGWAEDPNRVKPASPSEARTCKL
eukprot:358854-Chlamydomonas_euryale.AAC.2